MKTVIAVTVAVLVILGGAFLLTSRNQYDSTPNSYKASLYNRELTNCLERYDEIARVYDFDKMRDRTNEQIAEIVGTSVVNVDICR